MNSLKTTPREEARTPRRQEPIPAIEKHLQIQQALEESAETRLGLNTSERRERETIKRDHVREAKASSKEREGHGAKEAKGREGKGA